MIVGTQKKKYSSGRIRASKNGALKRFILYPYLESQPNEKKSQKNIKKIVKDHIDVTLLINQLEELT